MLRQERAFQYNRRSTKMRPSLRLRFLLVLSLLILPLTLLGAQGDGERPEVDEEPLWRNPESVKVQSREMAFTDENFSHPKNDNIFF